MVNMNHRMNIYIYVQLCHCFFLKYRALSRYPKGRLSVGSCGVSGPRGLELSDRSGIWQALQQQCCWCPCHVSERYDNLGYMSRGFGTLRDLAEGRLFGCWDGAQVDGVDQFDGLLIIMKNESREDMCVVDLCSCGCAVAQAWHAELCVMFVPSHTCVGLLPEIWVDWFHWYEYFSGSFTMNKNHTRVC